MNIILALALIVGMATAVVAQDRGQGIRLHQPSGKELYVNPRAIAFVRIPIDGEEGKAIIVFANGGAQPTTETVKEVVDLIAAERFIIAPFPGECRE